MEKNQLVDFLYYKKLPVVYQDEDLAQKPKLPLYRYLQALFVGGDSVLEDINNILLLTDPEKCPDKFFPYLVRSFGLQYFEDIPISYQRKLLGNIGELYRRRGTSNCIRYLARVLTGMNAVVDYNQTNLTLTITLIAASINDITNMETSKKVILAYLKDFLPYYVNLAFRAEAGKQVIESDVYHAGMVISKKHYVIESSPLPDVEIDS